MNCDHSFVSMNSKTEYYDSDKILSKWGFTDNQCHNCGISNSDINGLLMQCGKCRKAYYCSMKCFNDHLPEHNKYCGTKSIQCQPKGKGIDVEFKEKAKKQPVLSEEKPKKVKAKKKSVKKTKAPSEKLAEDEVVEVKVSDFGTAEATPAVAAAPEEKEEEELQLEDLMEDLKMTKPTPQPSPTAMSQSFSHFGRGQQRKIPVEEPFVKEQVSLRHTEFIKHEYPWMTPEWINIQLRKTERGRKLLENRDLGDLATDVQKLIEQGYISCEKPGHDSSRHIEISKHEYSWMTPEWIHAELRKTERGRKLLEEGDLSGPVTDVKSLIEQGYITWEKPEWTQPKLRKTARGEAIKREAIAHENSFKEERAHHSFSH